MVEQVPLPMSGRAQTGHVKHGTVNRQYRSQNAYQVHTLRVKVALIDSNNSTQWRSTPGACRRTSYSIQAPQTCALAPQANEYRLSSAFRLFCALWVTSRVLDQDCESWSSAVCSCSLGRAVIRRVARTPFPDMLETSWLHLYSYSTEVAGVMSSAALIADTGGEISTS